MNRLIKTTTVLFVAMMLLSPVFSQAQSNKKNVIKTNLLSPVLRSYNLYYERALGKKTSLQMGAGWQQLKFTENNKTNRYQGFRLTPEFRYYPAGNDTKAAPKGFFVGGYLMYQNYTATSEQTIAGVTKEGKARLHTWGGGAILGYQWLINDVLSIDLFAGLGPFNYQFKKDEQATTDGFKADDFDVLKVVGFLNTIARFGVSIGVAF